MGLTTRTVTRRNGAGTGRRHVTAIVIAGAGARGAYEAGLLSVLVPRLLAAPGRPGEKDDIVIVGTSAGAINAAALAAFADPEEATAHAIDLWTSVRVSDIFRPLHRSAPRTVASVVGGVVGADSQLQSLLDSSPLRTTMQQRLDWAGLRRGLTDGTSWVDVAGIVTTASTTGRTTVFLQGHNGSALPGPDVRRGIDFVPAELDVDHVLASAAIPIAFRPVFIDGAERHGPVPDWHGWHVDGGVRLNAPIMPALRLGADRVVIVNTTPDPDLPRTSRTPSPDTDIFDSIGTVFNAVLNDRMAEDVRSLRRTNAMVAPGQGVNGEGRSLVPHIYLGPPDAGIIPATATSVFTSKYRGWRQLSDLGVLGRLIGGSVDTHGELLSHLFFDRSFHAELVDLGRQHASTTLGPAGAPLPWRC